MDEEIVEGEPLEPVAAVTYSVKPDGEMQISVHIDDYSPQTLDQFSLLYASIPTPQFQRQGLEIIKQSFDEEGHIDEFTKFLQGVLTTAGAIQSLVDKEPKKGPDEPLISPTDLM